jgi:hypothetical protein
MILSAHAVSGAAFASLTPDKPLVGFVVGFPSHFVLDAIPHWDYSLESIKHEGNDPMKDDMVLDKRFLKDILKISADAIIGLLLAYLIFGFYLKVSIFVILCGAVGAMMPDALAFVYMKWKHEPLTSLQRFHIWIHADK